MEYGVYVVSMGKGEDGNAFTASWVTQVSSEPPMVSIAVHNKHQSNPLLKKSGAFVVNLIGEGQEAVAKTYYGPAESGYEKLKGTDVVASPGTGTPLIKGAVGFVDCRIVETVAVGNHTLFVGEVVAAEYHSDNPILTTTNTRLVYTG
jgi:flavin reductase (DIM6/NTAB) family NADH-FMN oxidoreductase RutF